MRVQRIVLVLCVCATFLTILRIVKCEEVISAPQEVPPEGENLDERKDPKNVVTGKIGPYLL